MTLKVHVQFGYLYGTADGTYLQFTYFNNINMMFPMQLHLIYNKVLQSPAKQH